jgi:Domain of unknown function (DUF4304)
MARKGGNVSSVPAMTTDAVQTGFLEFGKRNGLVRRNLNLYKVSPEVIGLINLQKSAYGPKYYLNVGFWIQQPDLDRYLPKEPECHVRLRLGIYSSEFSRRLESLLDLASEIEDEERSAALADLLVHDVLPLVDQGSDILGLKRLMAEDRLKGAAVSPAAMEALAN